MKTLFKLNKPLSKCFGELSSLWLSSLPDYLKEIENKMNKIVSETSNDSKMKRGLKKIFLMMIAHVGRAVVVKNTKSIIKAFPRFIIGLILLVWVAPYADTFYTRLDFNDRVSPDVWYYESYHWLFLCLGPYLKNVLTIVGLYFIFVHKSHIKAYVLAFPMMYDLGKIIWLLQVENHTEYKTVTPEMYILYGLATGLLLIGILDLLSFWLFHREHAIIARLTGLRRIVPHAEPQMIVNGFAKTMDDAELVKQFQS